MTERQAKIIPVAICLLLLAGMAAETWSRPGARNAEPFHKRLRDEATKIPVTIGDWQGKDEEVPVSAQQLLRPNVLLQRRYSNAKTGRTANFLVVQCKTARDMGGHYPPACYPRQGWTEVGRTEAQWTIGSRKLIGMEYEFRQMQMGRPMDIVVYSLLLLPNGTYARSIEEIREAAGDYLRQSYGAAQIQLLVDATIPPEERLAIFREIIGANLFIIDALRSGGTQ